MREMGENKTITFVAKLSKVGGNYLGIRIPWDLMELHGLVTGTDVVVYLKPILPKTEEQPTHAPDVNKLARDY